MKKEAPYRKHILKRDGYKCALTGKTENLDVHHVKTIGSGGKDEYLNMITLWHNLHIGGAHGKDSKKVRKECLDYLSKFNRPDFWNKILKDSEERREKIKKNNRSIAKKKYNTIKNNPEYKKNQDRIKKEFNEKHKEIKKKMENEYIESFKKKNEGLSPFQVQYRKQKEFLKKRDLEN